MINEWALVVQKKISLMSILFLAHSFPTMGFLSKRVAETWMMEKDEKSFPEEDVPVLLPENVTFFPPGNADLQIGTC